MSWAVLFSASLASIRSRSSSAGGLNVYGDFFPLRGRLERRVPELCLHTPEVHRWHHAVELPDDPKFRYGCNYGVGGELLGYSVRDILLPKDEKGRVVSPSRLGHPGGYPDEPNYLKILLAARAFPSIERLFDRKRDGLSSVPAE